MPQTPVASRPLDPPTVQIGNTVGRKASDGAPTVNETDTIMQAVREAVSLGGGTVTMPRGRSVRCGPTLLYPGGPIIPTNVTLVGSMQPLGNRKAVSNTDPREFNKAPGLYVDQDASINLYGGSATNLYGVRTGFTDPVPGASTVPFDPDVMRQALDIGEAFGGTFLKCFGGVQGGADDRIINTIMSMGFDVGLHVDTAARVIVHDFYGDDNFGVKVVNSGGTFRWENGHITSFVIKNLRGTASAYSPIAATFQDGTRIAIVLGNTPDRTRIWKPLVSYSSNTQSYYGANKYKSLSNAISGDAPPVHTSGRASDAGTTPYGVDWRYNGAYTGSLHTPSVWDALLQAGDYVLLNVDPVFFGGDVMDVTTSPYQRGRVPIYRKHDTVADCWILDVPWDPVLAAAMIGTDMVVQPGTRPGVGYYSENADTAFLSSIQVKGPRIGYWINGSAHVCTQCNFENAGEGETDADDGGNICVYLDDAAVDCRFIACALKSARTIIKVDTQSANDPSLFLGCEINYSPFRTIDIRRGTVQCVGGVIKGGVIWLPKRAFIEIDCDAPDIVLASDDNGHFARYLRTQSASLASAPRQKRAFSAPDGIALIGQQLGIEWTAGEIVAAGTYRIGDNPFDENQYLFTTTAGGTCGTEMPDASPVKVTGATRTAGVVTATFNKPHNARVSDVIHVYLPNTAGADFAGVFTITGAPDAETLTWAQALPDSTLNRARAHFDVWDGTATGTGVFWTYKDLWLGGFAGIAVNGDAGTVTSKVYDTVNGALYDGFDLSFENGMQIWRPTQTPTPAFTAIGLETVNAAWVNNLDSYKQYASTTSATPVVMTSDNSGTPTTSNMLRHNLDKTMKAVDLVVSAVDTATGNSAEWKRPITLSRLLNNASLQVANGGAAIAPDRSRGAPAWTIDITVDTTANQWLKITCNGAAATNIRWTAWLKVREA